MNIAENGSKRLKRFRVYTVKQKKVAKLKTDLRALVKLSNIHQRSDGVRAI